MFEINNKSNTFYLYNFETNEHSLIATSLIELFSFISKGFSTNGQKDPSRWSNKYFDELNLGNDLSHLVEYESFSVEGRTFYSVKSDKYFDKKYLFYDGNDRIINITIYTDEVIKYYKQHQFDKHYFHFFNKYKKRQGRKRHRRTAYPHISKFGVHQAKKYDSIVSADPEMAYYHIKKIETGDNQYPRWFDDSIRVVEGNWKSQYKVKSQHNIHNGGKTNKSIRKYYEDDFTQDDIDDMLYNDFINNKE